MLLYILNAILICFMLFANVTLAETFVKENSEQMVSIQKPFENQHWTKLEGKPLEDKTKVLIANEHREALEVKVIDTKPELVDGEITVVASVDSEDGYQSSPVDCKVEKDTVTCEW